MKRSPQPCCRVFFSVLLPPTFLSQENSQSCRRAGAAATMEMDHVGAHCSVEACSEHGTSSPGRFQRVEPAHTHAVGVWQTFFRFPAVRPADVSVCLDASQAL